MYDQVSDVASTSLGDDGESDPETQSKSKTVHSLVEKKRRDKQAQYVAELSKLVPMCGVMRKLDKITVLRMAVQHVKAIKGSKVAQSDDTSLTTSLTNDSVLKAILESAKCFLFVVACDRGKFLYVSESVERFIHCPHTELIGQSIFDLLHSKDISRVKEQLIASDVTAREVFIDTKTMEPVNPGVVPKEEQNIASPGASRSFFCRMKDRLQSDVVLKSEPDVLRDHTRKKKPAYSYVSLHCTGFLKTWESTKVSTAATSPTEPPEMSCNLACLVAIAKLAPRLSQSYLDSTGRLNMKPIQFYARINSDHRFSFVEPMVTYITGFFPQDLVGSSVFDLFANDDVNRLKDLLHMATRTHEKLFSPVLKIQTTENSSICVRIVISSFTNPFTSELEHIVLDTTAVPSYTKVESSFSTAAFISHMKLPKENSSDVSDGGSIHTDQMHSVSAMDTDTDINNDTSKAIMMSLLDADGGLGHLDEDSEANPHLSWLTS